MRSRTWNALLEELVEVQGGGSGVGLLGSGWRGGGLLCFLHGIFNRGAGVGPAGEVTWWIKYNEVKEKCRVQDTCYRWGDFHLGLVFVLMFGSKS